jgi:fused signal recognition particle receptor
VSAKGQASKPGLFKRLFGAQPATDLTFEPVVPELALPPGVVLEPGPAEVPDSLAPPVVIEPNAQASRAGWLSRLKSGLVKSSAQLAGGITSVFVKKRLDAGTLEELEDLLIQADLGVDVAGRITARLKKDRFDKAISPEEVRGVLAAEIASVLEPVARPLLIDPLHRPHVILMVGVNGTGKTTTIGKLAARFRNEGRTVMIAAGDTFRAAAIEQLQVWGSRTGAEVIARPVGADAAGLAFDALQEARRQNVDVLMIDTAGRLQNKAELMAELEKVVRVLRKLDPTVPHDVLLTLDATTGQNAVSQVNVFREKIGVTGLVMTKLDGTARGGILVALAASAGLPVHAIGVGEAMEDLQPFNAKDFADAIAGNDAQPM